MQTYIIHAESFSKGVWLKEKGKVTADNINDAIEIWYERAPYTRVIAYITLPDYNIHYIMHDYTMH